MVEARNRLSIGQELETKFGGRIGDASEGTDEGVAELSDLIRAGLALAFY